MFAKIKNSLNQDKVRRYTDVRNIVLYVFAIVVLAITWSSIKTIQRNYELQKEVSTLKQQNELLNLYNGNMTLQNKYLETDEYLELAARQNLGLAAPGEKVLLVPKNVSQRYLDDTLVADSATDKPAETSDDQGYRKNLQDWWNFLMGKDVASQQ